MHYLHILFYFLQYFFVILFTDQLFSTKERIETVWHHESPTFVCVAVDSIVFPGVAGQSSKRFCSAALFSMDNQLYSIDIGSNDADRFQLEVIPIHFHF